MPGQERKRLLVLMVLHLLWGLILWFSISKYGLGVSTDAVHQLFGGLNLASGRGLTSYDGSFLILWPPLYPTLLALVHIVTGLPMLETATALQAIAFLGLAWSLSIMLVRIFPQRFGLAIAAALLMQVGSVMVVGAGMVGSDYVHIALVALTLVLTGCFIEGGSKHVFVALAAACILTTLQRYLGVAAVAAAALAILVLARGTVGQRARHAAILGLTILPMATWLVLTSSRYTLREPITLAENFAWFSKSVLEWFLGPIAPREPVSLPAALLWFLALSLAIGTLLLAWQRRRHAATATPVSGVGAPDSLAYLLPILLYGLCYIMALFGSASLAYFNKLGGRFILPLYIPLMLVPVAAADAFLRVLNGVQYRAARAVATAACCILLTGLGAGLLRVSIPIVIASHAQGVSDGENAFNTRTWHENLAIDYWQQHVPDYAYRLLSNEPDGVTFHTMHAALPAPRRTSGPYGEVSLPLEGYASELSEDRQAVFLVWIEPSSASHYYSPAELKTVMNVVTLFESDGGSIYALKPGAQ